MKTLLYINPVSVCPIYDYEAITALENSYGYAPKYMGSFTRYNNEYLDKIKNKRLFKISSSVCSPIFGILNYVKLIFIILWMSRKYDFILLSFPQIPVIDIFLFLLLRKKLIYLIHNPTPHSEYNSKNKHKFTQIYLRLSNEIWFASKNTLDESVKLYGKLDGKVLKILQHGVMPITEQYINSDQKDKTDNLTRLMFVGSVKPYKGVDILLNSNNEAFIKSRFEFLGIYGKWSNPTYRSINVPANINIKDAFISAAELKELFLDRRNLFIIPYRRTTQSGMWYNFMYYKALSVVSNSGDPAEWYKSAGLQELIFNPEEPETLQQSIEYVLDNEYEVRKKISDLREKLNFELTSVTHELFDF